MPTRFTTWERPRGVDTSRVGTGNLKGDLHRTVHPQWASHEPPRRSSSFHYLLDLDVDLAEALDGRMRLVARPAVTAFTFETDPGEIELDRRLASLSPGPGLLILEGVLAVNVRVGDRIAAELLGPGDLIEPPARAVEELLACVVGWRALVPMRFAVLDAPFAERVRPWPQLIQALLRRSERRTRNLNVQRAIACQPRLDIRLALLLWHLAARWGRVEPGGIRLPLPLTHQLLGRLVGAERPSVSHALARLAQSELVTGHGDEWHLHGRIKDQLAGLVELPGGRLEQISDAAGGRH
ncbi:MAG: helix-turn-helix domain-containing protein [Solirubrobacteraceae bacterium]